MQIWYFSGLSGGTGFANQARRPAVRLAEASARTRMGVGASGRMVERKDSSRTIQGQPDLGN